MWTVRSPGFMVALFWVATGFHGCKTPTPAQTPLRFAVPKGWTEFSKDVPDLPKTLGEGLRTGRYSLLAGDVRDLDDAATMVAVVRDQPFLATRAWLRDQQVALPLECQRKWPGSSVRVLEADIVTVASTRAGRFLIEIAHEKDLRDELQFYLSARGERLVVISYGAKAPAFGRYRQIFDESAQATGGLAEPSFARRVVFRGQELVGRSWWR